MPLGVEDINIFVVLPDDIVGYTDVKKSCAILLGTKANSSKYIILNVNPLIAPDEVDSDMIIDLFSNSIDSSFHFTIPCCKNIGTCSYAFFILCTISVAVLALLARMPIILSALNNAYHNRYPLANVVVLPDCLDHLTKTLLFSWHVLINFFCIFHIFIGCKPKSCVIICM